MTQRLRVDLGRSVGVATAYPNGVIETGLRDSNFPTNGK